jgi:hypothetical protein
MIKATTRSGFEFELAESTADNMELVEVMAEIQDDGNPVALATAVKLMLGADQQKALYNHVRTEDGRVPVAAIADAFTDIVKAMQEPGKN